MVVKEEEMEGIILPLRLLVAVVLPAVETMFYLIRILV